jgi:hypothetical protein
MCSFSRVLSQLTINLVIRWSHLSTFVTSIITTRSETIVQMQVSLWSCRHGPGSQSMPSFGLWSGALLVRLVCIANNLLITSWCSIETIAFHSGIMLACYIVLNLADYVHSWNRTASSVPTSDLRKEFRFVYIHDVDNPPSSTTFSPLKALVDPSHAVLFLFDQTLSTLPFGNLAPNVPADS